MGVRMHTYTSKTLEKNQVNSSFHMDTLSPLVMLKVGQKIKTSLTTTNKQGDPPLIGGWGGGGWGDPQNEILIQGLKRQDMLGCKCNHLSLKGKV